MIPSLASIGTSILLAENIQSASNVTSPRLSIPGAETSAGGYDEDEEELITEAHYAALRLAIYAYYGINELH